MRAFIIRPFGTRQGIDFDEVESKLIAPALLANSIDGRTTAEFSESGSIHSDMFRELLETDVVIADVSLHNANVFYELGVRHALKKRVTALIRTRVPGNETPFDIQGYRYITYDSAKPEAAINELRDAISQSLYSEEGDSPVWKHLPNLEQSFSDSVYKLPSELSDDIALTLKAKGVGKLRLMIEDVRGARWEKAAMRAIGAAQFDLEDFRGALQTWTSLRGVDPDAFEVNRCLAFIYQRLGKVDESDLLLKNVLNKTKLSVDEQSEFKSQLARNARLKWSREVLLCEAGSNKQAMIGLRSSNLAGALSGYRDAAYRDLNNFYCWQCYLSMLVIVKALSEVEPNEFDSDLLFQRGDFLDIDIELTKTKIVANLAVRAADEKQGVPGNDPWVSWAKADLAVLCGEPSSVVKSLFRRAYHPTESTDFHVNSVRSQLLLMQKLGLFKEQIAAALTVLPIQKQKGRALLFSGLMANKPGRFEKSQEAAVKQRIKQELIGMRGSLGSEVFGIAGGASGGDIIFHEACQELGIPSYLHLCLGKAAYEKESVEQAGDASWVPRFHSIFAYAQANKQANPHALEILGNDKALPKYLIHGDTNFWIRANRWLVHSAMALSDGRPKIILLTDGMPGNAGGTRQLVDLASEFHLQILAKFNPAEIN